MELIHNILGEYTYNFISLSTFYPIMLFITLLYGRELEKRRFFPLILALNALAQLFIIIGLAVLRTNFANLGTRIFAMLVTFAFFLPMVFTCYRDSAANKLMVWCAAIATEEISSRFFTLLVTLFGNVHYETISLFRDTNDVRDWIIFHVIRISSALVLCLIFRRAKSLEADRESARNIAALSTFFAVWLVFFQAFSREYMRESDTLYFVINISDMMTAFFVLTLRTGILSQNQYRQEIAMTEKLLSEERKQYDSVKENIDIVNMRCHDLKHQLEDLSYKLTEGELIKLKDAIKIYDSSIKTGNEVLDVVIYEKQLIFNKENIRFTCMADGDALKFMRTTHVYALFNNALGNALEAVRKLTDPDKKIIDLSVKKSGKFVEITVTNYFIGEVNEGNATTKSDKNRHGFGIKSMKYIAEQYGGTLSTSAEGEVFELGCTIPIPEAK